MLAAIKLDRRRIRPIGQQLHPFQAPLGTPSLDGREQLPADATTASIRSDDQIFNPSGFSPFGGRDHDLRCNHSHDTSRFLGHEHAGSLAATEQ